MKNEIEERIAALSPEKRALLEFRLKKRPAAEAAPANVGISDFGPRAIAEPIEREGKRMDFSLFFFSDDGATSKPDKYRLLIECAKYADANGFAAVWTPERHFKPFGGLYPNPSVIAAALSMITTRLQLRAGSVVLPLHHPLRVAEEWALVDNLSGGRVGVAFASGWLADDFVLAPERYNSRKQLMFQEIETVRRLWSGECVRLPNGNAIESDVRIYPSPIQQKLPIWITSTHRDTFVEAGKIQANVLTGLMEQSLEQCAECIRAYRQSLAENGHDPSEGRVAVMLHTFLGGDLSQVKETVRHPFGDYLRSFLSMSKPQLSPELQAETEDQEMLLDIAFERYFSASALLGSPESCRRMIMSLRAIDADEVACLLDFGLDTETILNGLPYLNTLKDFAFQADRARAHNGKSV